MSRSKQRSNYPFLTLAGILLAFLCLGTVVSAASADTLSWTTEWSNSGNVSFPVLPTASGDVIVSGSGPDAIATAEFYRPAHHDERTVSAAFSYNLSGVDTHLSARLVARRITATIATSSWKDYSLSPSDLPQAVTLRWCSWKLSSADQVGLELRVTTDSDTGSYWFAAHASSLSFR